MMFMFILAGHFPGKSPSKYFYHPHLGQHNTKSSTVVHLLAFRMVTPCKFSQSTDFRLKQFCMYVLSAGLNFSKFASLCYQDV